MVEMTGGQAVARSLRAEGVEVAFGIVGTHNFQIFDGLFQTPEIRVVTTRHEQGAGFMADGYARATGKIAAAVVVPGPGLTNILTAMGQSYSDSVPFITITGQNPSDRLDRELEDFHELRNSLAVAGAVSSFAVRASSGSEIPSEIRSAMQAMRGGRPRPTFMEVPMDILGASTGVTLMDTPLQVIRPAPPAEGIARAATLLAGANRPVVIAGGGVIMAEAQAELLEVARLLGAPVITTCHGKGALPDDHTHALGDGWGRLSVFDGLFAEADACLAVGTRFEVLSDARQGAALPEKLVHIDIDGKVISQVKPATVGVVADARLALAALRDGLRSAGVRPRGPWCDVAAIRAGKVAALERAAGPVYDILRAIRANTPRETIFADDLCLPGYWAMAALDIYEPRTYFHPGMYGTLGYALPAGIGAALGRPDRPVVAMAGDGGFMYTSQELATAVQQKANVTAIVFNDNAYGALKLWQDRFTDGRYVGVALRNPDFARLGEAYGARGIKLESHRDLGPAVADAVAAGGPTVIECPLDFDRDRYVPPWVPGVGGG